VIGVGLSYREPAREEVIGAALDGLAGCAKPARRLRDGQRITREDAQGVPARLRLALLTGDRVSDPAEEARELEHIGDELGHGRILIRQNDNMLSICHTRTCYRAPITARRPAVQFASIRIITDDLDRLVAFYEQLTGVRADRPAPPFAELVLPTATLAIGHSQTVALFGAGSARAADNHTVIIEFRVDDVDAEYARLRSIIDDGSRSRQPCHGATARSCSVTPMAISSTCSRRSPKQRSSGSEDADRLPRCG
jgi:predicted enzyme related to lactoylglutathione lyase